MYWDRYHSAEATAGYRDQYPGVPADLGESRIDFVKTVDEHIAAGEPMTGLEGSFADIYEGRKAGAALAPEDRPTTELIDRWTQGGHIRYAGYILGKKGIVKVTTQSQTVAIRHGGKLYYAWGGMPGHRFPDDAIGIASHEFQLVVRSIKRVREIMNLPFMARRHRFPDFCSAAKSMPVDSREYRAHQAGELQMLRLCFGDQWTAAIKNPDMKTFYTKRKILHGFVKTNYAYGNNDQYLLLSIDDAIEIMMSSSERRPFFDLTKDPL